MLLSSLSLLTEKPLVPSVVFLILILFNHWSRVLRFIYVLIMGKEPLLKHFLLISELFAPPIKIFRLWFIRLAKSALPCLILLLIFVFFRGHGLYNYQVVVIFKLFVSVVGALRLRKVRSLRYFT